MNHFVLLVMDSCRYDSVRDTWGELSNMPKLGELEKAHSFATWTLPSHIDFLAGRLPWRETKDPRFTRGGGRFHFERIGELKQWQRRLEIEDPTIISDQYRIHEILHSNGYKIKAITSASPIGKGTMFSQLVDEHVDVGSKGDTLLRAVEHLNFDGSSFYIVNICETHYPFWIPGYDLELEKRVMSGLRGLARAAREGTPIEDVLFSDEDLMYLRGRQRDSVRYVDSKLPNLLRRLPENTSMVITADHGEAFGEGGYIGHGEVAHSIVLEVPFIEVSPERIRSLVRQ
ncbi:MAG: hypothetical protein HYS32_00220 [Candidatus Woesearchaeota archaeon]|nr:MAG: hypothetical protein HYS32_00220 [Candidatus Woesearchaeota archaeon]